MHSYISQCTLFSQVIVYKNKKSVDLILGAGMHLYSEIGGGEKISKSDLYIPFTKKLTN